MSCSEVKGLIQLYMDSELDGRSTLEVQQHLERCGGCRRVLEGYQEQDRKLKEYALADPIDSSKVRDSILEAIRREPDEAKRSWLRLWVWRRVAVIAILIASAAGIALEGGWLAGIGGNVYAAVVADHADHCSVEDMEGGIEDEEGLKRLAGSNGKMNRVPKLSSFGYGNPRGQVCMLKSREYLHLVYNSDKQEPVSVFVRVDGEKAIESELRIFRESGYEVATVTRSGAEFIVVSRLSEKQMTDIAASVANQA